MSQGQKIAAVLLVLMVCLPESEGASVHRLCGKHLVDTLLWVCEGKGLYYRDHKGLAPSISHRVTERKQRRFGIVEKCCLHSCTLYELQTYCKA